MKKSKPSPNTKNKSAELPGSPADAEYRRKAEELQKQNEALLQEIQALSAAQSKSAEAMLRDSARAYQAIVEHGHELFYSHTADHVLTYVSPQSREILGCEPAEALVRWTEFLTDNPQNELGFKSTQRAIDTGEAQPPYELELKTRDGRVIWGEVRESPIVRDGKTTAIVGALLDITERKKSIESLRHSEEMYRLLAENMRDVVWFLDIPTMRFTYVSPSAFLLLGYAPEEVMKKSLKDILTPASLNNVMGWLGAVLNAPEGRMQGQTFPFREVEQIKKNGTTIWTEISTSFLFDENQVPVSVIGVSRDIHARKSAEAKFIEQEERLRLLVNSTPDIFCFKDGGGRWLQANESIVELFNLPRNSFLEKGGDELLRYSGEHYTDAYQQCYQTDEAAWKLRRLIRVTETIPDCTGNEHVFDVIKIPLFHDDGSRRGLIVYGRDITDRIETENRLKFINDRLDLISRVVSSVVGSAPTEEQVTQHIELVREAFNIDVIILRELAGDELRLLTSTGIPSEKLAPVIKTGWGISKIICETKEPFTVYDMAEHPATRDFRFIMPGTYEGKSYAGAPLMIEDKVTGILGIFTSDDNRHFSRTDLEHLQIIANHIAIVLENDKLFRNAEEKRLQLERELAERKIIEEELRRAKEKAEEAARLKSSILANMGHELRTPLIGILGFSELLTESAADSEQKRMAASILRSGQRLLGTLNLILDLSRIEANKYELEPVELNVADSIRENARAFEQSATEKGLSFSLQLGDANFFAMLDVRVFHSVLSNILDNAVKFTETGGITISLEADAAHEKLTLRIADSGIGMSENNLAIVFAEFRQASEGMSRAFEGTGLGLTLTKKMMELMGGGIAIESKEGRGTTVTLGFPMTRYEEKLPNAETLSASPGIGDAKPVMLLIDDDPVTCNVIKFMVSKFVEIDVAADFIQAKEKLPAAKYRLVLLDINLGSTGSGLDVLREIRKMRYYDTVPVVALTAYAMAGDQEKFIEAGCSHYISKPFTKAGLVSLVTSLLEKAEGE